MKQRKEIRLHVFCLTIIMVMFISTLQAEQKNIVFSATFSEEDVTFSRYNDFDLIGLSSDKVVVSGDPGKPLLPSCIFTVLLPPETKASGVEAVVYLPRTPGNVGGAVSSAFLYGKKHGKLYSDFECELLLVLDL